MRKKRPPLMNGSKFRILNVEVRTILTLVRTLPVILGLISVDVRALAFTPSFSAEKNTFLLKSGRSHFFRSYFFRLQTISSDPAFFEIGESLFAGASTNAKDRDHDSTSRP